MRALVTGGCGFIGSNLTISLDSLGWHVDVVDRNDSKLDEWRDEVNDANFFIEDYADEAILAKVKAKTYDVIFHLAAEPSVSCSVENPAETNDENIGKMVRLIEAAAGNCGRFVFSSSSAIYGNAEIIPTSEESDPAFESPYALQKFTGEEYLRIFAKLKGLDSICLRYFNVYGPRQYGDSPYANVISAWLHAIYNNQSLRLDGNGKQYRDFCYVDDVVRANLLAAKSSKKFRGQPINIGSNETASLNDILSVFKEKFDGLNIRRSYSRAGDVFATQADTSKALDQIGYYPTVGISLGLSKTIAWWNKIYNRSQ